LLLIDQIPARGTRLLQLTREHLPILRNQGLAIALGARLDREGQIVVDQRMRMSVPRLYAAGCVTPANCQMIIAAGGGATAAQAINRDLFEESVRNHWLRRFREVQLEEERTVPEEG
jgi:hypothetical protein